MTSEFYTTPSDEPRGLRTAAGVASANDRVETDGGNEQSNLSRFEFADLTESEREVYRLVERDGYAPADIAQGTQRDASTVRTLLHRARKKRGELEK